MSDAKKLKDYWQRLYIRLSNPKSGWQTGLLVLLAALIYAYRAHPYLSNPQLYAEDGVLWLAEGHNKNILAIFQPVNGFLHLPERVFGYVIAHLPLQLAPAIFVVTAWIFFILTVYYFLSSRTNILKNNFERLFMVGSLALIANIEIFFFNFSNSVFLMGIIAALIFVAKRPKNRLIDILERIFYLFACFTLPFSWFLFPMALFERLKNKGKDVYFLIVSGVGMVTEIIYYLTSHVNRSPITLLSLFSKWTVLEVYNQLAIPALRLARVDMPVADYGVHHYDVFSVLLVVLTLSAAGIWVFVKSKKEVRYLLFFLVGMTFASIKSPTLTVKSPVEALQTMAVVTGAGRYFVYGIIGFSLVLAKSTYQAFVPKVRYYFLLGFFAIGFISALHYGAFYVQKNFVNYTPEYKAGIKKFELPQTRKVVIPVNPGTWHLTLTKP